MSSENNLKAVDETVKRLTDLINIQISPEQVKDMITQYYDQGMDEIGLQFGMNFTRDPRTIKFLETYTFDNIKGMQVDMKDRMRKELMQGIMNMESTEKIKDRIRDIMDVSEERARMIARTEANRALNAGHEDAARQSGLSLKRKWDAHLDNRTSEICRSLDGQVVGMDEPFHCEHDGKDYARAPAHVNCRSRVIFVQVDK